jgi:hypothetical protein
MADMSKYASAGFIKVDDLADGPEQKVITKLSEGQWGKPVATFEDGSKLSLNGTNINALIRALGKNHKDWIGKRIELEAGTVRFNGKDTDFDVLPAAERTPLEPQPGDLNDEVPF